MNELITIHDDTQFPIDGRELHTALSIETPYNKWFPRMCEYGFVESVDFRTNLSESTGGRPAIDHQLTVGMAKELCMIQRTEIGRQIRRYLIQVEESWNDPQQIMARALRIANDTIKNLTADVSKLTVETQIMAPKADYFDQIVDRNLLTNFRETAKQFGIKPKAFITWLIDQKYIYRDQKGKLLPYEKKNDGLFEVKECLNEKTQWSGTQTLITPKGRETFRLLTEGMN